MDTKSWVKAKFIDKTDKTGYCNLTHGKVYEVSCRLDRDYDCYDVKCDDAGNTDRYIFKEAWEFIDVGQQNHYARFTIEPLEFIETNNLPFWAGNVIKYVCRWDAKDGLRDLKKARDYLDKKIAKLEGKDNWLHGSGE